MARTKRTYNLSPEVVAIVKRLVESDGVAPTQDALVERAILQFERHLRDAQDARRWEQAADDGTFRAEQQRIFRRFGRDDAAAFDA